MNRERQEFLKRAVMLGGGALLLFVIVALATYPYERAIDRALATIGERSGVMITTMQTEFFFPNRITFYDLKLTPKERPYHLMETEFLKLSAEVGLKALLTRTFRVRFNGELESGDPREGNYGLSGTICLRRGEDKGSGSSPQARMVQLRNVHVTGSDVNLTIDGDVSFFGDVLNPVLALRFSVEKLNRTDSANYGIDNLLKFVEGGIQNGAKPPLAFAVSGPFSRLTVREEKGEGRTEG